MFDLLFIYPTKMQFVTFNIFTDEMNLLFFSLEIKILLSLNTNKTIIKFTSWLIFPIIFLLINLKE